MARSNFMFIFYLVTLASFVTTIHGRRLNDNMHEIKKQQLQQPPPSARNSLFLSSLPKGTVPNSAPTKKGHSLIVDEKLIARHLAALDRILRSVPSPGVASFVTTIHGRRLNDNMHEIKKQKLQQPPPSARNSLFLSSLPKGTVPNSAPTKKGHSLIVDEKLIARHLAALDRILRSVPSPGVGN